MDSTYQTGTMQQRSVSLQDFSTKHSLRSERGQGCQAKGTVARIGQSAKPDSAGPRRSVPHTAQPPMAKRRKKPNGWRLCKTRAPMAPMAPPGAPMAGLVVATGSPTAQTRSENTIFVQTRGDPGSDGVQRPGPLGLAWLPDGFPGLPWTWPPEPVFWVFGWARRVVPPEHQNGTRHPARWSSELAWPIERA
jgi:hypothetical protein